jgi:DNA recombination protein Rad52
MGFSDKQVRALGRGVPASAIRTRMNAGKELTFIEGWYAVAQANRIFGFDGWDRETVETRLLQAKETRGTYTAIYAAKVRVTVRAEGSMVVREGHGTGEGQGTSAAEVQDRALKAAETDATKRALATFGRAFGLALYVGDRRTANRTGNGATPRQQKVSSASAAIRDHQLSPEPTPVAEVKADDQPANGVGGSRVLAPLAATSRIQKKPADVSGAGAGPG